MASTVGDAAGRVVQGGGDAPGRGVEVLGRVGLVAYGAVHVLIAVLIVRMTTGARGAPADQGGAVAVVAAQGLSGRVLLAVAMVGLVAFGVWQVCAAVAGFRWVHGRERMRKRVGAAAKAIAVFAVVLVMAPAVVGDRSGDGNRSARSLTASLLALPGGQAIVAALGGVALVVAASMVYTGLRATFIGDLWAGKLTPTWRVVAIACGSAGNLGRAVALGGVGVSFAAAAVTGDAGRSAGPDGVLDAMSGTTSGAVVLLLVAAGIAAFGVYCGIDAYARRA